MLVEPQAQDSTCVKQNERPISQKYSSHFPVIHLNLTIFPRISQCMIKGVNRRLCKTHSAVFFNYHCGLVISPMPSNTN